jgi:hypothetical protein
MSLIVHDHHDQQAAAGSLIELFRSLATRLTKKGLVILSRLVLHGSVAFEQHTKFGTD